MNKPKPPKPAKRPTTHPLWPSFVRFVRTSVVVHKDLLKGRDWPFVWHVFLAGACA